jgi:hypothetical protein
MYVSGEDLNKTPPCNPNPTDVGVISMIVSRSQYEHLPFNTIVDFSGLIRPPADSLRVISSEVLPF